MRKQGTTTKSLLSFFDTQKTTSASEDRYGEDLNTYAQSNTQCSKIGKKCKFKSAKKRYLHFQKWQEINFFTRKKFKIAFLLVLNFFLEQKIDFLPFLK